MTPTRPQLRTLWFAAFAFVSATAAQAVNPPVQPAFLDRSVSPAPVAPMVIAADKRPEVW